MSAAQEAGKLMIRPAVADDAGGVAAVLTALVRAGKRTARSDAAFALAHYINHPDKIACHVTQDEGGRILGFQSLILMRAGNAYGAPPGWGFIGTHISPEAARRGVGKALFRATLAIARDSGVPAIEAFIGADNRGAEAYYEAMGFRDHRAADGVICKALMLP